MPLILVSTVTACVEEQKNGNFWHPSCTLPPKVAWAVLFQCRAYSELYWALQRTESPRSSLLPGGFSLSSRGQALEDSQCLAAVSPWEALLCPGLRAGPQEPARLAQPLGLERELRGSEAQGWGLQGATREAGLCWVLLAWL